MTALSSNFAASNKNLALKAREVALSQKFPDNRNINRQTPDQKNLFLDIETYFLYQKHDKPSNLLVKYKLAGDTKSSRLLCNSERNN